MFNDVQKEKVIKIKKNIARRIEVKIEPLLIGYQKTISESEDMSWYHFKTKEHKRISFSFQFYSGKEIVMVIKIHLKKNTIKIDKKEDLDELFIFLTKETKKYLFSEMYSK
jgi:hypothetical protein